MVQMLYSPRRLNDIIAHEAGVKAELDRVQEQVAAKARAILARHHRTGAAQIETSTGKLDRYVSLVDHSPRPAAAAIEFGHVAPSGRFVPGIHALTGAL
jgi:hypothetical protein